MHKIRRFLKHPARTIKARVRPWALRLRTLPVFVRLANRGSRAFFVSNREPLSDNQKRIVKELRENGIAVTSIEALFNNSRARFDAVRSYTDMLARNAEIGRKKQFLRFIWGEKEKELDLQNPFNRLAIDPMILGIVNEYFGLASYFYFSSGNIAMPVGNTAPAGSQRWHRDPGQGEDRTLKMFMYVNDVDKDTGPFEYVRQSQPTGALGHLFPLKQPDGLYPPLDAVESHPTLRDNVISNTGHAGTIIFCDTLGLHRGGFAREKERVMLTAAYTTPGSAEPRRYTLSPASMRIVHELSPTSRFALGVHQNS